jgi:hypothetical protein
MCAFLVALVCACSANEPPVQKQPVTQVAPPLPSGVGTPATAPVSDVRTSSASDVDPPIEPHRALRGELIRSYIAYSPLRKAGVVGGTCVASADAGACDSRREAAAVRTAQSDLTKRLDEAKAFASNHPDTLADEQTCIVALIAQADRLASALESHLPDGSARAAVKTQITKCDDAMAPIVAANGAPPFPTEGRDAGTASTGRIAPTEVQAIVRGLFSRFKPCYTAGLRNNPLLGGLVETNFVIDTDGSVADVRTQASTLPDHEVSECLLRAFARLKFPSPEGGYVTVVYPLIFTPGDH